MLTTSERKSIIAFKNLSSKERWNLRHRLKVKVSRSVSDLAFILDNREVIGTISEMAGEDKTSTLFKQLALELAVDQAHLSPEMAVTLAEENRVLSEILAKKNKVWRDLLSQVNSAKGLEDYIRELLENNNVYIVDKNKVRVHVRK